MPCSIHYLNDFILHFLTETHLIVFCNRFLIPLSLPHYPIFLFYHSLFSLSLHIHHLHILTTCMLLFHHATTMDCKRGPCHILRNSHSFPPTPIDFVARQKWSSSHQIQIFSHLHSMSSDGDITSLDLECFWQLCGLPYSITSVWTLSRLLQYP